jgi:hypothetical protein
LDLNVIHTPNSKGFIGAGVGYSYVKLENIYTFTTAGSTAYSPMSSFTERATGNAVATVAYVGWETYFTDNATIVFDGGYRYIPVRKMSHQNPTTTFQGTVAKGDSMQNDAGVNRLINLSGAYVGASFRFYINF